MQSALGKALLGREVRLLAAQPHSVPTAAWRQARLKGTVQGPPTDWSFMEPGYKPGGSPTASTALRAVYIGALRAGGRHRPAPSPHQQAGLYRLQASLRRIISAELCEQLEGLEGGARSSVSLQPP